MCATGRKGWDNEDDSSSSKDYFQPVRRGNGRESRKAFSRVRADNDTNDSDEDLTK